MPAAYDEVAMTRINLPTHPLSGLAAIGFRRNGQPIFPAMGGDGTTPPPPPVPPTIPPGDPATALAPPADQPLGPAGLKALQAEREAREALEKELAPLKQLAAALSGGKAPAGKSEIELINERLASQDKVIADQAVELLRSAVATDKKLTAEQAAELRGGTREELIAHADRLIAAFGKAAEPIDPRRPGMRPDPAQGAQPGAKPSAKEKGAAEAAKRFGPRPTT